MENNLQFNEITTAEFYLNRYLEIENIELVDVRIKCFDPYYYGESIHSDTLGRRFDPLKFSRISAGRLTGYFRARDPRKKKIYKIARISDPEPIEYEEAYYLKDCYQPIKDYVATYPAISKIDPETWRHIEYNSQWVIYKICI
jgi:hypothetical protein